MDVVAVGARATARHRRLHQLGQIGAGASLLDRLVHAGGVARGRPLQKGNIHRQSELLAVDSRRRWFTRNSGKQTARASAPVPADLKYAK